MKPRPTLILLLWVIGAHFVPAQDYTTSEGPVSIVLLFDLSYSMSLPLFDGALSRLDFAKEAARRIIGATDGRGRWAVVGFEDTGSILGNLQFTTSASDIQERITELQAWGRSPMRSSLEYVVATVRGPAHVVVFSDLLETELHPPGAVSRVSADAVRQRLTAVAGDRGHRISFLFPEIDTPAQDLGLAELLASRTGGAVYDYSEVAVAVAEIADRRAQPEQPTDAATQGGRPSNGPTVDQEAERSAPGASKPPPQGSPTAPDTAGKTKTDSGSAITPHEGIPERLQHVESLDRTAGRATTRHLSWLLFALAAISAAYIGYRVVAWLRTPVGPPKPLFLFRITGGEYQETDVRIGSFPVKLGNGAGSTIRLPSPFPGRGGRSADVRIDRESARAVFSSTASYNINGVGKRHKVLKDGDRIRYGRYTVEFRGLKWERPSEPVSKPHLRFAAVPLAAIALAVVFRVDAVESAFQFEVAPPRTQTRMAPVAAEITTEESIGEQLPFDDPEQPVQEADQVHEVVVRPPPVGGANTGIASVWFPEAGMLNELPKRARYPYLPTTVDLDVLFIHAHPDDEALDFGALAAAASAAGLKTGILLFTDGNAGLDQYPWREADLQYPARRMQDAELAQVRIGEAERAMARLGVDLYIRLGLVNHPYAGILEQLTVQETVRRWGGFDYLVDVVASTIAKLQPELLVSPDSPSEASEHFEHEAVGIVTAAALRRLGQSSSVRAHLAPVDPLQTGAYSDVRAFDAWKTVSASTEHRYRDLQLAALREHRTQRDASVIGIEVRQGLRYEYYRVLSWRLRVEPPSGSFRLLFAALEGR